MRPLIAILLILASAMGPSKAGTFTISVPVTTGDFDVKSHNEHEFARGFGFSISTNLSVLGDDDLVRHIRSRPFKTRSGFDVTDFMLNKKAGLAIGVARQTGAITINATKQTAEEHIFVVSVRNKTGDFAVLGPEDIGVITLKGRPVPFNVKPFKDSGAVAAYFAVVLDRSGSMSGVIDEVVRSAAGFMKGLPANARCQVWSFNTSLVTHSTGFQSCDPNAHALRDIEAGGGTLIYETLLEAYGALSKFSDGLKAVVLVTDGNGQSELAHRDVLAAKTAPTHVLWLGSYDETRLQRIADTHVYGRRGASALLQRYFDAVKKALRHQYVVVVPKKAPAVMRPAPTTASAKGISAGKSAAKISHVATKKHVPFPRPNPFRKKETTK